MNKRISLLVAILFIVLTPFISKSGSAFAQQVKVNASTPGGGQTVTITDPYGGTYSAYLHLPSDYNTSSKTYPLLVFLHGMGEAGTDLSMIYNNGYAGGPAYLAEHNSLPAYTSPTNGQSYEFIVLAPQATWFSTSGASLNNLLKGFIPNYRVDTSRLYLTGLSAGGQGVTEYMVHSGWTNQYTAAAVIPMSEAWYYPSGSAQVIVNDGVYNWGFGSDPEDRFGVLTHNLMNEIGAISPSMARYTNYSGGHCCWNAFYDPAYKENIGGKSMNIYQWLLQYARGGTPPPTPANQAPTANAGADQTITLPTNSLTLTGSGTDSDGSITKYAWSKTAGGTVTIASPSAAATTIGGLTQGTYTFRLTVTDNQGATATDDVNVIVNAAPVSNPTPTPSTNTPYGGTAWSVPGTIQAEDYDLGGQGIAYSDADANNATGVYRPNEGVDLEKTSDTGAGYNVGWIYNGEWTKYTVNVATAGTYTFQARVAAPFGGSSIQVEVDGTIVGTIAVPVTGGYQNWQTASLANVSLSQGTHVIRVISVNGGYNLNYIAFTSASTPTPTPTPTNVAPTANAGADQTITLPTSSLTLSGSGTDSDGSIAKYEWSQQFGPNTATISSVSSASTKISNLIAGSYRFRLTVTDNAGATGYDDVNVGVTAAPVANVAPTANAGADQTITLPVNSITLTGSGTDSDGSITRYEWTKISGATLTMATPVAASTTVTGLTQGTYTFRLTVTDNSGAIGTDDVNVTVNAAVVTPPPTPSTNTPYGGTAAVIPGTIQAENFDLGGEGIGYHDLTPSNAGYQYRSEGVDIEAAAGGGYNVGWTLTGEWMKYTVNVASTGTYALTARVASPYGAKTFSVEMDGVKIATMTAPLTGTWQTWKDVAVGNISLTAGTHVLRVYEDQDGYNLDSLTFTSTSGTPTPTPTPTPTTGNPYGGVARPVPGTIQAEDFDLGGDGVGYHDADPNNATGVYRPNDGVDLEKTSDIGGGYNIGWTNHGEWTNYTVNVAAAGTYTIEARLAGMYSGKTLRVDVDGVAAATLAVPVTYNWQAWQTATGTITLPAGVHTIKLYDDIGAATSWQGFNINYFAIK